MKRIPLRTCVRRHPRMARVPRSAATKGWRPLSLRWPRREAPAALNAGHSRSWAIPQIYHTNLHLNFAVPGTRAVPPTEGSSRHLSPAMVQTRGARRARMEPRHPLLQNTHSHSMAMLRELTHLSVLRHERALTTRVYNATKASIHHTTSLIVAKSAPPGPARAELPSAPARPVHRRVTRMPARVPYVPASMRESRIADSFVHATAPNTPLVWRKAAPSAPFRSEAVDAATTSSASSTALPAIQAAAPAAPTSMPQQVREAVRANLLDGAVADRFAEDVIRRVEKRMRIERERRGH